MICIIPARGGSKGLPNKNLRQLNGIPLIGRPIRDVIRSGLKCEIFVTTDSDEIRREAMRYGADCPDLRDPMLALDTSTTEETLRDALERAEDFYQKQFDYCLFLTTTDVYRDPQWINECFNEISACPSLESVFIGYNTTKNYWELQDGKWIRLKEWMKEYSSRQTRQTITREDTGVCCISKSYLWRSGRRIGDEVKILVKESPLQGLDIHTELDLQLSSFALSYLNED